MHVIAYLKITFKPSEQTNMDQALDTIHQLTLTQFVFVKEYFLTHIPERVCG